MRYELRLGEEDERNLKAITELEGISRAEAIRRGLSSRLRELGQENQDLFLRATDSILALWRKYAPEEASKLEGQVVREVAQATGARTREVRAMLGAGGVKLMTADELEEQRRREENPFG